MLHKTTASAAALACPDILVMILEQLAPGQSHWEEFEAADLLRLECRNALAACAVTGRVLSSHALDVLWRELDDIHPLLKLLPGYKCIRSRFMLCAAILPEHWERLQVYAPRIRIIWAHPPESDDVHSSVWMFLAARCRGVPLIPHLRELNTYCLSVSETPPIALLVSPSLRALDLGFTHSENAEDRLRSSHVASSFIQNLPVLAPHLESLIVRGDFKIQLRSLQSIHMFTRLKCLSTPPTLALDEHTLRVLSTIATLHDLSCWIDLSGTSEPTFGQDAFHQLTSLTIRGASDHVFEFMLASQLSSLGHFDLRLIRLPSSRHPRAVFAALVDHCDPRLLTSLEVSFSHDFVSRPDSLMEYFEPLLGLPHTTSFHAIFSSVEPSICDDDLCRFGQAWPPLARFHVEHRTREYAQEELVRPTLSGLIALARLCPFLTSLHIPELDPRATPDASTGAVPALGHGLRFASIINIFSPPSLEVYLEVAGVLDRVFPAIDLDRACEERLPWGKGWEEVLSFLKAMRVGRVNGGAYADLLREVTLENAAYHV